MRIEDALAFHNRRYIIYLQLPVVTRRIVYERRFEILYRDNLLLLLAYASSDLTSSAHVPIPIAVDTTMISQIVMATDD